MKHKTPKILIVEDDAFLLSIYERRFVMDGFEVLTVKDGETALSLAPKSLPDCVLLDILLPKLDGMTVLERLKRDITTQNIPVLLLTNLGQKTDRAKGMALGAADYMIKAHFRPSEVVKRVREIIGLE
ncbi:MAG: response regulator [bacterium]|nr:response regulator [bacterium]